MIIQHTRSMCSNSEEQKTIPPQQQMKQSTTSGSILHLAVATGDKLGICLLPTYQKQNQIDTFTLSQNSLDIAKVHFPCRRKLLLSYWPTWPELGLTWCCTGTQLAMPSEATGRLQETRVVSCTWNDANLPCSGTISLILLATSTGLNSLPQQMECYFQLQNSVHSVLQLETNDKRSTQRP